MYNPTFTDPDNELLKDRLSRVISTLRGLSFSTREEYQAEVYNQINRVVNTGYAMSKLELIDAYTPAKVGDIETPLSTLNNDAIDIIHELKRVEDQVSQFYNLSAAAENELRQRIRTTINASTKVKFNEGFIDSSQISRNSGSIDNNAGHCTTAVISEKVLTPAVTIGPNSIGSLSNGDLSTLADTSPTSYLEWTGVKLELIFSFSPAVPLNRIYLKQYDYKDLSITLLNSTPDGTFIQDILAEVGDTVLLCDIASNKSSGETTIDFSPKNCQVLSMVIEDRTGSGSINLDWIQLIQRQYQSSSIVQSVGIATPTGDCIFNAESITQEPYSLVNHQISFDGTTYISLNPGQYISIPSGTYWYRGILSRNENLINQTGQSLNVGIDPASSPNYSVSSSSSVPLGSNLLARTLVFNNISGPVSILDSIIPNSLSIQIGSSILPSASYSVVNGVLVLNAPKNNVTVTYQTAANSSSLAPLVKYFSPILVSYSFERI